MKYQLEEGVDKVAVGTLGRVFYAQLSPGEDVYKAIQQLAAEHRINTGLVLSLTGAFSKTRLSMPTQPEAVDAVPQIFEIEGSAEVVGGGLIGRAVDTWDNSRAGIVDVAGTPYLHVHVTVNVGGQTYCGHLIEGCIVHSLYRPSHYTMVVAEVNGLELDLRVSPTSTHAGYSHGVLYHDLKQG